MSSLAHSKAQYQAFNAFQSKINKVSNGNNEALESLDEELIDLLQSKVISPSQFDELEADIGRKYA